MLPFMGQNRPIWSDLQYPALDLAWDQAFVSVFANGLAAVSLLFFQFLVFPSITCVTESAQARNPRVHRRGEFTHGN